MYGVATEAGTVQCVSPPRHDARTVDLELALNAQQYTKDELPFVFYHEVRRIRTRRLATPEATLSAPHSNPE